MSELSLLEVENLEISYSDRRRVKPVVHGVSFAVGRGEVVALVGESGSGKTTTAQSVIGLLPSNGRIESGAVRLNGIDIADWDQRQLDAIRGSQISLIPQDPTTSLNPIRTIGAQVDEMLHIHRFGSKKAIKERSIELLAQVGLKNPALRYDQYPHELSGGMRQRVLIAIAMALRPQLIIADEPTSALDVTVQRHILDLIDELRAEIGTSVLLVTHDLGVAADRADRTIVMKHGRIEEQGSTREILRSPVSQYARQLLADAPSINSPKLRAMPLPPGDGDAVVVEGLVKEFATKSGGVFRSIDGISFRVARGTTHAIVGESGSGKTTTVRNIVGFQRPTAGSIRIDGTEMTTLSGEAMRRFRKKIQLVHQNPFSSLDPRQTVFSIVEEPLLNFEPISKADRERKVRDMISRVGLPEDVLQRNTRALSGGQRQRVAIARALVLEPEVVVLDEAVSALDVTIQAQILKLLVELQTQFGLTFLFISHDLAVVRQISDTVSVLQAGRIVDSGTVDDVFERPTTTYTRELIDAIPGARALADA